MPDKLLSRKLLARNTLLNLVGSLLPVLVALFAIPILIREMGTERFGILSLVWMFVGYFSLFDLGLGRAVTKLVAEKIGRNEEASIPPLVGTAMLLMLLLSLFGAGVLVISARWLVTNILNVSAGYERETILSFYLVAAVLPFLINTSALRGTLIAYQRFGLINAIRIPQGILNFLAPLVVVPFTTNLVAVVGILTLLRLAVWCVHLAVCIRCYPLLFRSMTCRKNLVQPLFHFGGWMTVTNVVSPMMTYLDRFFIGSLISLTAVTFYTAPYQIVSRLVIIPGALLGVLFPAFSTAREHDGQQAFLLFQQGTQVVFFALFPVVTLIFLFAREGLQLWLGDAFAVQSTLVLQLLVLGMLVNCLALVPFTFLQGVGRPDLTAKFHLLELPLYIGILYFVLPNYGIIGAAAAWSARVVLDCSLLYGAMGVLFPVSGTFLVRLALVTVLLITLLAISCLFGELYLKVLFLPAWCICFAGAGYWILLDKVQRHVLYDRLVRLWQK